jgi:hypothetical protein
LPQRLGTAGGGGEAGARGEIGVGLGAGDGATVIGAGFSVVVTRMLLIDEKFPAESNAETPKVYLVFDDRRMNP